MFSAGGLQGGHRGRSSDGSPLTARTNLNQVSSPEVHLLLRGPDDKRDVAVLPLLRPHLKGRSFQDVSVHHRHRADEAPFDGEVKQVVGSPGRVLLPRDGLEDRAGGFYLLGAAARNISSSLTLKRLFVASPPGLKPPVRFICSSRSCDVCSGRNPSTSCHHEETAPPCGWLRYLQDLSGRQTSQAAQVCAARLLQEHQVVGLGLLQGGVVDVRAAHVHRRVEEALRQRRRHQGPH